MNHRRPGRQASHRQPLLELPQTDGRRHTTNLAQPPSLGSRRFRERDLKAHGPDLALLRNLQGSTQLFG